MRALDDSDLEATHYARITHEIRADTLDEFLGVTVPLPRLSRNTGDILTFEFEGETREVLDYRHFSVLMSKSRRQCRKSASNISGRLSQRTSRKG